MPDGTQPSDEMAKNQAQEPEIALAKKKTDANLICSS